MLSVVEVTTILLSVPGVQFLLSEKLCQDPLESFFGKQQYKGGRGDRNASKILKFKKGDVVCEIANILEQGQVSRIRYPERIDPLKGMKSLSEMSGDSGKSALKQLTGMVGYIFCNYWC